MANIARERFHKEALKHLELAASFGLKGYHEYDNLKELRESRANVTPIIQGTYDFSGEIQDIRIPSKDVSGGIPVYVYKPSGLNKNPCIWIFFHGGGFVVGSREEADPLCKIISQQASCIVVNVEYRLAPEHKYPAAFDDAESVTAWVMQNKTALGATDRSVVGIGGVSAGGSISASTALDIPGIAFQVLIYPRLTERFDLPSAKEFATGPFLDVKNIEWFDQNFYKNEQDFVAPRMRVLRRDKFDHAPPALFIVAELDMLRDESYAYKEKLEEAGVKCDFLEVKGVPHGFFILPATYKECTAIAYKKIIDLIKEYQEIKFEN